MNPPFARCAFSTVTLVVCAVAVLVLSPPRGYADEMGRPEASGAPPADQSHASPRAIPASAEGDRSILIWLQELDCVNGNAWFTNVNSTNLAPYIARDDFEISANGLLNSVAVYGTSFDGDLFCDFSNIESFRVRVYEKVAGGDCGCDVGALVGERIVPIEDADPTFECFGGLFNQPIYRFGFDFNEDPIILFAGGFILEVAANLWDPADCVFMWSQSVVSGGCIGHTVVRGSGTCAQPGAGDVAFTAIIESLTNDNCPFATPIPDIPYAIEFNNAIATNSDGPAGSCNALAAQAEGMDNDVWLTWTPVEDGGVTLIVDHVDYDGLTAVYVGPHCDSLTEIACGDEPEPYALTFPIVAGETYWFQIGDWGTLDGGGETIFSLGLEGPPLCPEDLLVSAGGPDNPSYGPCNLYRVDADTGAAELIGPIGFSAVRGLDFAPDGTLYATATDDDAALLLTIDPDTGAGALVGEISHGGAPNGFSQISDIAFDETGALFGYADNGPGGDALYRIDLATAEPTPVDFSGFTGGGNGIAINEFGRLYHTPSDANCLAVIDRGTGEGRCLPGSEGKVPTYVSALDFCRPTGALYGAQPAPWSPDGTIVVIDVADGTILRQVPTIDHIAALCIEETGPPTNCDGRVRIAFDNGAPDLATGMFAVIDDPLLNDIKAQAADDFAFYGETIIDGVHWVTFESIGVPLQWSGKVLVQIYQASGCFPSAAPAVSRIVPDDGGIVSRKDILALFGFEWWRYDVTGLDLGVPPGHYFLSVAPMGVPNTDAWSNWATARGFHHEDDIIGCEAVFRGDYWGLEDWTAYGSADYDLAFQLTTCLACPGDLTGDSAVNADDLFQLLSAWGSCPGCPEDLTGDDTVNADDLFELLSAWGPCG